MLKLEDGYEKEMLRLEDDPPITKWKYAGGLQSHLRRKVMLFKLRTIDEVCV
jgi:hypothetical protein